MSLCMFDTQMHHAHIHYNHPYNQLLCLALYIYATVLTTLTAIITVHTVLVYSFWVGLYDTRHVEGHAYYQYRPYKAV